MPKVAVYTRTTTGGSSRRYTKAARGSTGPSAKDVRNGDSVPRTYRSAPTAYAICRREERLL
jgi:hypothetical protein